MTAPSIAHEAQRRHLVEGIVLSALALESLNPRSASERIEGLADTLERLIGWSEANRDETLALLANDELTRAARMADIRQGYTRRIKHIVETNRYGREALALAKARRRGR